MPNSITQGKTYVKLLDEVYKNGSATAILDSNEGMIREGENGKDILVPKMSLDGLASTTRGGDYVEGDESLTWETRTPDYDRNRMFKIDSRDNVETAGVAYGMLAGEFERTKVIPELDAVRFAKYATNAGTSVAAGLADASAFLTAVATAMAAMDDAEVPTEGRVLFATSAQLTPVLQLDTTKSRQILERFAHIVTVPSGRFYSEIDLKDGTTSGQTAGGYAKASNGVDLNFLIVHPTALIQGIKHRAPKVVSPEENQSGDNWKFGYRIYGINEVLDNKTKGIYCHKKTA